MSVSLSNSDKPGAGCCLIGVGYVLFAWSAAAGGHSHSPAAPQFLQFTGVWPATLALSVALIELLIAFGPLKRREPWALAAAFLPVPLMAIPRIATDPRCLASITTVHGCHTFLIAMAAVTVGAVVAGMDIRKYHQRPA